MACLMKYESTHLHFFIFGALQALKPRGPPSQNPGSNSFIIESSALNIIPLSLTNLFTESPGSEESYSRTKEFFCNLESHSIWVKYVFSEPCFQDPIFISLVLWLPIVYFLQLPTFPLYVSSFLLRFHLGENWHAHSLLRQRILIMLWPKMSSVQRTFDECCF